MSQDHSARRLALHDAGGSFDVHRDRMKAREAAEALFAPKRQISEPQDSTAARVEPSTRKPRILCIAPKAGAVPPQPDKDAPVPEKSPPSARVIARAAPERPAPRSIPPSDAARIRTWLKYGMTVREVAEMYGVGVREIEGVLKS